MSQTQKINMRLNKLIKKETESKIENLKESIKKLEDSLKIKDDTFVIDIISYWANEGENSIRYYYTGKINDAIKKAENNFLRINNRSDIQGEHKVYISLIKPGQPLDELLIKGHLYNTLSVFKSINQLPDEFLIELPEQYWSKYTK